MNFDEIFIGIHFEVFLLLLNYRCLLLSLLLRAWSRNWGCNALYNAEFIQRVSYSVILETLPLKGLHTLLGTRLGNITQKGSSLLANNLQIRAANNDNFWLGASFVHIEHKTPSNLHN